MNSPGVKRLMSQTNESNANSDNGVKKRCTTPSIMSYFSPKPRPNQQSSVSPQPNSSTSPTITSQLASIKETPVSELHSSTNFTSPKVSLKPSQQHITSPQASSSPQRSFSRPLATSPSSSGFYSSPKSIKSPSTKRESVDGGMNENSDPAAQATGDINHAHLSYKFLQPQFRRDINMRSPDDPDYDEKTLYVPPEFLKKETPAMRQWWSIKQRNMDAVLFFKMGKFYELFNEDAVIGVTHLDLIFMKTNDDRPAHAGFPEISFSKYADKLIKKGFKVMRIEQTETPAMMEERVYASGVKSGDKVVKREICQVITKGTQMLSISQSVFHSAQNQYLLAVCEGAKDLESGAKVQSFGVCFIDVTIGKLYLGQFDDDKNLSNLNILLAHHTPSEILYERNHLSADCYKTILKTGARLAPLKATKEFWPLKRAISHLKVKKIFSSESGQFEWPQEFKSLFQEGEISEDIINLEPLDDYRLALHSFGAIVYYLNSQLIEKQVLACATIEIYTTPLKLRDNQIRAKTSSAGCAPMVMDHVALKNLEVFQDNSGNQNSGSTLFDSINYCKTHFGQRLLKNWICSPLCDVAQIENRLDAVEALISNKNASLMNEIVHMLGQTPDLERMLSKIKNHCFKSEGDTRAVMFDGNQYNKAKVTAFVNLLTNFKRIQKFINSVNRTVQNCDSHVLRRLLSFTTDNGLYPEYSSSLDYFEHSFDHKTAQATGKIIPAKGVNQDYDECEANIEKMKTKLEDYLEQQKSELRCKQIEFFGSAKNRYQLQVPDAYTKKVPSDWRIESGRKGFKRYYTPVIDELFAKLTTYEEQMKRVLDNILAGIFEQFLRKAKLWSAAIECVAILDVLQSIATFARSLKASNVDICRPEFIQEQVEPIIEYVNGRHPVLVKQNTNYIPNDLILNSKLLLLSGANMGGKSTLMRQTALLVVLAQIGCYVPASSFKLTPVDRVFSRLGASDRLLEGESTFYTELVETSAMLRCASKDSLLLLDELGRGTSTFDGTAIAYSVIKEISNNIKCRCLFSTHYHTLTRDFANDQHVRLAHMACKVERDSDDDSDIDLNPLHENITFLYKIASGPAARSYGFNVAKLAGISTDIISEAFEKSKEIELGCKVLAALHEFNKSNEKASDNSDLKSKIKILVRNAA